MGGLSPQQYTDINSSVGGTINGVANIIGGNKAANALKAAQGKARKDLQTGYGNAEGYQQPIYDTAKGNYTDLSSGYANGDFKNPTMQPYQFDPNSVFQDPEYKASLRAGSQAINQGAQGKGLLFSGSNARDLEKYGTDLFAQRSDALYNRGFNATNTAYNQNAANNLTSFNEGNTLTQPLMGSANNLSDLAVHEGGDLANNDLGSGVIRSNNIMGTTGQLVDINSNLVNNANDFIMGYAGQGKGGTTLGRGQQQQQSSGDGGMDLSSIMGMLGKGK